MNTTPEKQKKQAHGITVGEMEELRYLQNHEPDKIEMMPGNNAGDKIKDKYFAEEFAGYQLPVHERTFYHVVTETRTFSNGAEPVKSSSAVVHKLHASAYEFQKQYGGFAGQITHILHNPELEPKERPSKPAKTGDEFGEEELWDMTVPELYEEYNRLTSEELPKGMKKLDVIEKIKQAKTKAE